MTIDREQIAKLACREETTSIEEARLAPKLDQHITEMLSLLRVMEDELRDEKYKSARTTCYMLVETAKALHKAIPR